ncbi:hypothetical protein E0765_06165 [Sulfuricurvum sp. IAE1]|uniref:hypothetical protein n=1 Tax=Sulfuricurvum sp. IAE1 TaxID=2546102 RepID=UPI001044050B|nr:hypothetical protein [Sulfuricurvum sp. IAE1]TDA64297.1 hypothetical protein E0765_06165 [Sulfuricurvum sp. IAE1]
MTKITIMTAAALVAMAFTGCDSSIQQEMVQDQLNDIHNQVVDDAIAQYNIAKSGGNAMDTCVQAGMVKAAMLQAKNETGYKEWDATEKSDCEAAGVPR